MKWINIKDEVPGKISRDKSGYCQYDYYLVFGQNEYDDNLIGMATYRAKEATWEFIGDKNLGVYSCMGAFEFDPKLITHWMPLPPNPE